MRRNPLSVLGLVSPFAACTGSNASAASCSLYPSFRGEWQEAATPATLRSTWRNAPATAGRHAQFFLRKWAATVRGDHHGNARSGPITAWRGRADLAGSRRFLSPPTQYQPERCHLCRLARPEQAVRPQSAAATTLNDSAGESPPACPQPCAETTAGRGALMADAARGCVPPKHLPAFSCQGGDESRADQG